MNEKPSPIRSSKRLLDEKALPGDDDRHHQAMQSLTSSAFCPHGLIDCHILEPRPLKENPIFEHSIFEPMRLAPEFNRDEINSLATMPVQSTIDLSEPSEQHASSVDSDRRCFMPSQVEDRNSARKTSENERLTRLKLRHDALWFDQFRKLSYFKEKSGHCCVPISFEDQLLARWVKRQRYQFKKHQEGKPSHTNLQRIQMLNSIGFIWDKHSAAWQEKFNELVAFQEGRGHCNVDNHQLSNWAKCQRRQYKLFRLGRPSSMTMERIKALNSIGFAWTIRGNSSNEQDETD
eukprot:scaffold3451_cov109-Cylindrotheca_fusiformis.AAC.2